MLFPVLHTAADFLVITT
uniref:Canine signal recognition particle 54k protein n=1 Tax=Canis lupus familiaris TaxID=9615 RepID=A2NUZ2_CANLF|nr:unnamed protein product [Canis lupus familiaris]